MKFKDKVDYRSIKIFKYEILKEYRAVLKGEAPSFEGDYISHQRINDKFSGLIIRNYYKYDGPSGIAIDTENFMRGSLVHDALYQAMRDGLLDIKWRKWADKMLRDICRQDGMSWFRSRYVYRTVRMFGEPSATPGYKF